MIAKLDVIIAILPLVLLIYLMTKKNSAPSNVALPATAIFVYLLQSLILSLQSVGAAMGNMVCINNIVAVSSILGVSNQEGFILKRTVIPMVVYGVIAACVGIFL